MSGTAALRAALSAIDAAVPLDHSSEAQLLIATKCKALLAGYDARWSASEWRAVELEQTVVLPVVNPETGRISRTWKQAGKRDGVVTGYGKTCLLEHKSCSEEIADPSAVYWRRLAIDAQVSIYMLQHWQSGWHLDGTLYDVIRKPQIRPKKLAAAERRSVLLTGRYCGQQVDAADLARLAEGADTESLALYGLRLAAEVLAEPQRYYQRRNVPRLDSDLADYAGELWQIGQEIQRAQLRGLHFKNSQACVQYGTPCEYLAVCSGHDTIESDRWERRTSVHEELPGLDGDGKDTLTHSRIKCFQTCRKKHQLRYIEGIRRRDEEDREALFLGTLLHAALEQWWAHQSAAEEGDSDGNPHGCPVIEAGQHAPA